MRDVPFAELIALARRDDPEALAELFQRYRPLVRTVADRSLPAGLQDRLDASDVAQLTLLEARAHLKQFRGDQENEWIHWLSTAARRNSDDPIAEFEYLLGALLERQDRGEIIQLEVICAEYPKHAAALREFFENEQALGLTPASPTSRFETPEAPTDATQIEHAGSNWKSFGNVPQRLGDYELLDPIARGGMGIVFRARQLSLSRLVAVKLILLGDRAKPDIVTRFRREAELMAQLQHPHIVRIYHFGDCDGWWYLSMDLVDGPNLAKLIHEHPVNPRRAAELMACVADAVAYAHRHGIVHRDLKPSNILLDTDGQPRVTDFGVAKHMLSDDDLTLTGQIVGTPSYLPPEQIAGGQHSANPLSDVYALGAILYETLVGHPPFRAETPLATLMQIRELDPVPPRRVNPLIPRDLETICLKSLSKAPRDRYSTCAALADDLQRFLAGQTILARPIPPIGRVWRWCERHRVMAALLLALVAASGALVAALVLYTVSVTKMGADLAKRNSDLHDSIANSQSLERLATQHARDLRRTLCAVEIGRAAAAWRAGDVQTMVAALQPFADVADGEEDLRSFAWNYLWRQQSVHEVFRERLPAYQYVAGFSPDGSRVAFAGADSTVRIYSVPEFQLLTTLPTDQREINGLEFLPNSDEMATTGDNGTLAVWDVRQRQRKGLAQVIEGNLAFEVAYSAPLQLLAVCGNNSTVKLIDAENQQLRGTLDGMHRGAVETLALSPNGLQLLTCGDDRTIVIWDLSRREALYQREAFDRRVSAGAWTSDGSKVIAGDELGLVRIFDSGTGTLITSLKLLDPIKSLAVSPKGLLLVGDIVGTVRLFDLCSLSESSAPPGLLAQWRLHQHRVYGLATSPDGQYFATASRDRDVTVCQTQFSAPVIRRELVSSRMGYANRSVAGPDARGRTYRVSAEGLLAFDLDSTQPASTLLENKKLCDLSLHESTLLASTHDGWLYRWKQPESSEVCQATQLFNDDGAFQIEAWDDRRVLVQRGSTAVILWDCEDQRIEKEWPACHRFGASPDRKTLVLADNPTHQLRILDGATLNRRGIAEGHTAETNSLALGNSGRWIYSGSSDRTIRVWNAMTGELHLTLRGHAATIQSLAVDEGETTLASSDDLGSVRLWDLRTGRELFELFRHDHPFTSLQFRKETKELWGVDVNLVEFRWPSIP